MNFRPLSKTPVTVLRQSLDAYALRHKATAENIANVESRDYRPLKVDFEENLRKVLHRKQSDMKVSDARHFSHQNNMLQIREIEGPNPEKVNLEAEMAELAKNQIRFDFSARALAAVYRGIRASITGQNR
ncbi:flagellar basal body rod protein FlgB [bacterium]|nr:flagellar basal body rod protein FlgB [bacterium]